MAVSQFRGGLHWRTLSTRPTKKAGHHLRDRLVYGGFPICSHQRVKPLPLQLQLPAGQTQPIPNPGIGWVVKQSVFECSLRRGRALKWDTACDFSVGVAELWFKFENANSYFLLIMLKEPFHPSPLTLIQWKFQLRVIITFLPAL